ncbi:unnamed protein product, partial [Ectocarpus fasciculatus]
AAAAAALPPVDREPPVLQPLDERRQHRLGLPGHLPPVVVLPSSVPGAVQVVLVVVVVVAIVELQVAKPLLRAGLRLDARSQGGLEAAAVGYPRFPWGRPVRNGRGAAAPAAAAAACDASGLDAGHGVLDGHHRWLVRLAGLSLFRGHT